MIPADFETKHFVENEFRSALRNSFWHLYLKEWRDVYDNAKFPKTGCLGTSRLDQMMRVLESPAKKSPFHDIEKWEYAIMGLNQNWQDFFRNNVFPILGFSAAEREQETFCRSTKRSKKARCTASSDDIDDAKVRSIIEINDDEERQTFF
jgi:hypothetical protein